MSADKPLERPRTMHPTGLGYHKHGSSNFNIEILEPNYRPDNLVNKQGVITKPVRVSLSDGMIAKLVTISMSYKNMGKETVTGRI